ncbi:MAG: secondary thiamine-phosphate synthase enzyme YjbQ, partial [Anaerolineae bacterium]
MAVDTHIIEVETEGNCQVVDLTGAVLDSVNDGSISSGIVTVCVVGSTAAITTTEYEPGLVHTDFRSLFERLAPEDGFYQHEATWHDDNGHSHVRASLLGPSITVPLVDGRVTLG